MLGCATDIQAFYADLLDHDPQATVNNIQSLTTANQYRYLYRLVSKYVPTGSRVLDWGCGQGHFSYYLLRRGYSVTAYSLQPRPLIFDALSNAEWKRLTFVSGAESEPVALPLSSSSFDVVFSIGVLEHVREIGGTELGSLRELRRVLDHRGTCIIFHLPNRFSYIEAMLRALHGRRLRNDHLTTRFHRFIFSTTDARALAGEAGFSVLEIRRYGFFPRNTFNRLPRVLAASPALAATVNLGDALLERAAAPIVQNLYLVLERRPQDL